MSAPGLFRPPAPRNEPLLDYAPGSPERNELQRRLQELRGEQLDIPLVIGGEEVRTGSTFEAVEPHHKDSVLAEVHKGGPAEVDRAIKAAGDAWEDWHRWPWEERAAVLLRAAELLSGPWRSTLVGATMLNQSKTAHQAEIDAAAELIDFWRFNVEFMLRIYDEQPISSPGTWNRMEYRPLEGFVFAVTPFNFTAIAGNLPTSAALMGNTVVWKPASTAAFSAYWLMRLLEEAGMPPGVINMLPGDGLDVSKVALSHPDLAGIHFTGSTPTFQHLWRTVGENIASYKSYPRIVGETGGKDFVVAHPSADPDTLRVALIRGAFEFQGQKCSAASRAYVARSVWDRMKDEFLAEVDGITMGDVTDFSNFMGAVIDDRAFAKHKAAIARVRRNDHLTLLAGGQVDDSVGYFVRPTVVQSTDPTDQMFNTEYFGPVLAVHVYEDADYDAVLAQMESVAPYALTGAIIAQDRRAIAWAQEQLRFAAGNFYINDKPTGAVVGQQPFGGARRSGTNDKAGSSINLLRWISARTIKETLSPPRSHLYPYMEAP